MFKKIPVMVGFLLLLSFPAAASITLLSPVNETLPNTGLADLGAAPPGDVILISISKKTGYGNEVEWVSLDEPASILPANWILGQPEQNTLTLTIPIEIPRNVVANPYNIKLVLKSNSSAVPPESVNLRLLVANGLMRASISDLSQDTVVNEPAAFPLLLDNSASIGEHRVLVDSSLSNQWFEPVILTLQPGEIREVPLKVVPRIYGTTPFRFSITSLNNGSPLSSFDAVLATHPTLEGKFSAPLTGFPVFTPALSLYYAINALLSPLFSFIPAL